jgi:hypothetical protein
MKTFYFPLGNDDYGQSITDEQIKKDLASDNVSDSLTFSLWCNFAENWLSDGGSSIYGILMDGFRGFNERTPDEIILDFELNCYEWNEHDV